VTDSEVWKKLWILEEPWIDLMRALCVDGPRSFSTVIAIARKLTVAPDENSPLSMADLCFLVA
jgi:hypothetical protein